MDVERKQKVQKADNEQLIREKEKIIIKTEEKTMHANW